MKLQRPKPARPNTVRRCHDCGADVGVFLLGGYRLPARFVCALCLESRNLEEGT